MALILGIDTSNYTTSCALYDTESNTIAQKKQLLPVKSGECGIRQSDAVFHHTKQLPNLLEELFDEVGKTPDAVCASVTPRHQEGSYMPCFMVGVGVARGISAAKGIPFFSTSHQQGHIMAALFSAGELSLAKSKFLAFHVSGGTTEAILVTPDHQEIISCKIVGQTLDLNAGQLVDRVGVFMGLKFPCGKELESLASQYTESIKVRPVLKGCDCCLSGFENKLTDLYEKTQNKNLVAAHTFAYVKATASGMTSRILEAQGTMPVVFAGGVMSNKIIRSSLESEFISYFANPEYSCDNAAGVAVIGGYKFRKD